jgi:hypothetical protein
VSNGRKVSAEKCPIEFRVEPKNLSKSGTLSTPENLKTFKKNRSKKLCPVETRNRFKKLQFNILSNLSNVSASDYNWLQLVNIPKLLYFFTHFPGGTPHINKRSPDFPEEIF